MASTVPTLSLTLFLALLLSAPTAFSLHSPESSPSPSPVLPPQHVSPSPAALSPSPYPALSVSPPAPPPADLAPNSPSPAPSSGDDDDDTSSVYKKSPSPSPAPAVVGDVSREDQSTAGNMTAKEESSGGMSGGKKAGVAIGVIAAGSVVGVLGLVYKKRQQNIRRAQYGYAARRDFL